MDRLGFFKQMLSAGVDAASSVMGLKRAADEVVEAVDEVMRGVKADIGLYLPSVDANMYDSASGTLYEVAQMGYTTLEAGSYYDGKCYNTGAEKLKEMTRRESLRISALRINKPYVKPATPQRDTAEKQNSETAAEEQPTTAPLIDEAHQQWLEKAVATAKRLGCSYLTMANFPDEAIDSQIEEYAKYYNLIAQMCQQKGLQLCIHPTTESLRAQEKGSIFEQLWALCDKELIQLALDTLECNRAEVDTIAMLESNKQRVPMLHIHDYGIVGESGKIDFDKIIATGDSCGVKNIYIEVSRCTLPPMNCLERSIYYTESLPSVKY